MSDTLGERLRIARAARGLTLQALEQLADVPKQTISDIERGRITDPGVCKVARLARALGVALDELCDLEVPA